MSPRPWERLEMNPDLTEIACILDRSGSMESIREDAIGGFNAFLKTQREQSGQARLTLVLFDNEYEVPENGVPLARVKPLDSTTFVPRGATALYDAIGRTINEIGARLARLPEAERPAKVVVAILTDGQENSSKEFTREAIRSMIEHQRTAYSWEFVYLAANQDAVMAASDIAIPAPAAFAFQADNLGIRNAMQMMSAEVTRRRKA
ncbi:MAG: vWA domain-containing protein [Planctomycetota bacterium]